MNNQNTVTIGTRMSHGYKVTLRARVLSPEENRLRWLNALRVIREAMSRKP